MRTSKQGSDIVEDVSNKLPTLQHVLRKSAQSLSRDELDLLYDMKVQFYDLLDLVNMNISMSYSYTPSEVQE